MLGKMVAKGEGGARNVLQGIALITKASEQSIQGANEDLEALTKFINASR